MTDMKSVKFQIHNFDAQARKVHLLLKTMFGNRITNDK